MKKILIALDNSKIYNEIIKENKYDIYGQDIVYKEGVLEYISQNDVDLVITKDDLIGDMTKEIYIKQIRLLKPNVKIILFVKELEEKYLNFLYNNKVFDVIDEKESISTQKIINHINGLESLSCFNTVNNYNVNNIDTLNVISKKKICVFGTSGSGKSYVSTILANIIGKNLNMETLLIDFDVQNSSIDIYNNLNCNNNILADIVKDVDNYTINNDTFVNNVYKKGKISYITNNVSIYDYQSNLCVNHYNKIYEMADKKYDVIISDIPSNIFLDITYNSIKKSDIIFFVINPNYISIRQAMKYLDLLTNVWGVDRNSIYLIINKITEWSLTTSQIEAIIQDYKIVMQIEYDSSLENVINGISNINDNTIRESKEVYKIFGIDKDVKIMKKERNNSFLYNIFRKGCDT